MRCAFRLLAAFPFVCASAVLAASAWPVPAAAERYVKQAVADNLALQAQALDVGTARARLSATQGARQPKLDFIARYSVADGGRTIDVPAGDLINPAYSTLNSLLAAAGRPAGFPHVDNLSIPLLREREQETKLRLTAPVFNAELTRWAASRRFGVESATAQNAAARRELRLGVLTAYYTVLRTQSAEQILTSATDLTAEALRTARALFAVDKTTEDRVLRAEADDLAVKQQLAEAVRDRLTALAAFNALLHRPLDTAVESPAAAELASITAALLTAEPGAAPVPESREELAALRAAASEAAEAEAAIRARRRPTLSFVADGGIQGSAYRTGHGANYAQASLVGEFNLWDGRLRASEIDAARSLRRKVDLRLETVREQLAVELRAATGELAAARAAYPAAERRTAAATRAFEIISARDREGLANQLAFLDARQTVTSARLNLELTRLRLWTAAARVDRALAATPLE
ncbi:MAG: TolC family protein [Verrucomicrobia bacterium]|nr:TolC family protein [Verrucomicrobiota bacterium]